MKRIRVLLLTLVLSISMLAPEFSMLPAAYADDEAPAVTNEQPVPEEQSSYDTFSMTELYDAGAINFLPEAEEEKITVSQTGDGSGLLFKGKVADFNSTYIELGHGFNFDSGNVGRIVFDGLKDKDAGMTVEVEVYVDDSKSPVVTIPLKRQMGKTEWENDGEQSISLGEHGIDGEHKHKIALLLKISGKKDKDNTSVCLRSIRFCKTTVPVMYFHIDESQGTIEAMNSSEDHSAECTGKVDLVVPNDFNNQETFRDEYAVQESQYGLDLEYIRGRGNSTWDAEKKPYKVKFDKKQDLFGFGKNAHWVLLANRYDNSLVRNRMTYWLGRELGMEYTPQCVPVEVVMNGEYYGSYLLCEQIRVGDGRVEIDNLDDLEDDPAVTTDLIKSGGYLLSMEYATDEDRSFKTNNGMRLFIESPDDNVAYFNEYIKAYMQKVENAIFGEGFVGEDKIPYTDYLDLDAAANYWWIQAFSENGDAYGGGSTYLYKKRDKEADAGTINGKLYWGPLWDFDFVAWGDLDYDRDPIEALGFMETPWFTRMLCDPEFVNKIKAHWSKEYSQGEEGDAKEVFLRDKIIELTEDGGLLDKYLKQMETSYTYDHEKWGSYNSQITEYSGEIEQLRDWIQKRFDYVDAEIGKLEINDHKVTFVIDDKVVKTITVHGFLYKKDFPEVPEKEGFVFTNWVDENGNVYMTDCKISEDVTLMPEYLNKSEIVQPKDLFFPAYEVYVGSDDEDLEHPGRMISYYDLAATVLPENAVNAEITWSSSDPGIATIDTKFNYAEIWKRGDVTITGTLRNGVSKSILLHIVAESDLAECEGIKLDKSSMSLRVGGYDQIVASPVNSPVGDFKVMWLSSDENVATVDESGIVKAVGAGTADILAIDPDSRQIAKCKITVKADTNAGSTVTIGGSTYKILTDTDSSRTAMLVKAKNAKTVVVPATIPLNGKKYSVIKIQAKAFAKTKAVKVVVKTKKLKKATVKGSLKGSKVKKIKVKVGKAKANKKYVKKYNKIFTKKNSGRKVTVN